MLALLVPGVHMGAGESATPSSSGSYLPLQGVGS